MELCTKILVTEDNEDTRELIARILFNAGYDVSTAENGEQALRMLEKATEPTLIFLDLMMPVLDGWSFLHRSRKSMHRVVTISAVHLSTLDDLADAAGVDANIQKPLFAAEILAVAARFCSSPQLQAGAGM